MSQFSQVGEEVGGQVGLDPEFVAGGRHRDHGAVQEVTAGFPGFASRVPDATDHVKIIGVGPAVEGVAEDRVTDGRQVDPDLVALPCLRIHTE